MARRGGFTNRGDITLSRGWLYQKWKQLDMSDIRPQAPTFTGGGCTAVVTCSLQGLGHVCPVYFYCQLRVFCAIELNIEDALYPEPGRTRVRTSSQDFEPGLRARTRARTGRRTRQFFAFPPFSRPANPMRVRVEFELGLS